VGDFRRTEIYSQTPFPRPDVAESGRKRARLAFAPGEGIRIDPLRANAAVDIPRHLFADCPRIAPVADACGYRNSYYFSRQFRQRVGITPSSYRKG